MGHLKSQICKRLTTKTSLSETIRVLYNKAQRVETGRIPLHALYAEPSKSTHERTQGCTMFDAFRRKGPASGLRKTEEVLNLINLIITAAVSIPPPHCILKCTYLEGGVSGFLLRGLRRMPICPIDPEDDFDTPGETVFFRVRPVLLRC